MDQKLTMLSKVPLLAGLSSHDLEEVGRLADEVDCPRGKVLAKEGAPGHEFFVILDGTVAIDRRAISTSATSAPATSSVSWRCSAQVPRTATATATTPAGCWSSAIVSSTTLLADFPKIQRHGPARSRDVDLAELAGAYALVARAPPT